MKLTRVVAVSCFFVMIGIIPGYAQGPSGAAGAQVPTTPRTHAPFDNVNGQTGPGPARGRGPAGPSLTLTTPDFPDGGTIPPHFTSADPKAVSPELDWTNVPDGTVSFALILHDPDTSIQRKTDDVLHWMVFNIPGTSRQLPQGVPLDAQLPDGTIQAKNLRGGVGFMGPGAPPAGPDHHYTFELFALDEKLSLGPDTTRQQLLDAMEGHILGKGVIVGRFHRPQPPTQ